MMCYMFTSLTLAALYSGYLTPYEGTQKCFSERIFGPLTVKGVSEAEWFEYIQRL